MRVVLGLLALVPVAILAATLLRGRIEARIRARRAQQERIDGLLQEMNDATERETVRRLQREVDAVLAREKKKQS